MLLLKQIPHKILLLFPRLFLRIQEGLQSLGLAPQTSSLWRVWTDAVDVAVNYSRVPVATFISNLLWLIGLTLKKLVELSTNTSKQGWNVPGNSAPWVVD